MKVKDFIDFIRPLTALNPETEVVVTNFSVPCDIDFEKIIIDKNLVTISVKPVSE